MTALVCHPQTPCAAVRGIDAKVARSARGRELEVRYRIDADLERLRIPPPRPAASAERLWKHTCCEIFVARPDTRAYHEFNFSPSGEWAAYAFSDYRAGAPLVCPDPGIAVTSGAGRLELTARLPTEPVKLRIGLSVVIEARDGSLSYWALRHVRGKPDFHHCEAFALDLE